MCGLVSTTDASTRVAMFFPPARAFEYGDHIRRRRCRSDLSCPIEGVACCLLRRPIRCANDLRADLVLVNDYHVNPSHSLTGLPAPTSRVGHTRRNRGGIGA